MNRDKLEAAGVDYDEGVDRFSGIKDLYEQCLIKFFNEKLIEKIEKELEQDDFSSAKNTVHALKGESGNLSINRLYKKTCILMELLRNDPHPDKDEAMALFSDMKKLFRDAELAVKE